MQFDAIDLMRALLLVLVDTPAQSDAIFVYSRDDGEDEIAGLAAHLYHEGRAPRVIVNGVSEAEWVEQGVTFGGHEMWRSEIMKRGVPDKAILSVGKSLHTAQESNNLVGLALERGWKRITILALPYHILRCFLSLVFAIKEADATLDVFAATLTSFDWDAKTQKQVLGGKREGASRIDQITGELERIDKYKRTSNATFPELFSYLEERNKKIRTT